MKKEETNKIETDEPIVDPAVETATIYADGQAAVVLPVPDATPEQEVDPAPQPEPPKPDIEEEEEPTVVLATVTERKLNLRERPNKASAVLRVLSSGDQLEIINTAQGWAKVCTIDGLKGYVMKEYIEEV